MAAQIITADVDAYDPSIPGVKTLRFSTQGYVTKPTDTPANTYYDGRIQQAANMQRSCFDRATTFGRGQISYGDMVLLNQDGGLDGLLDYSFIGRPITIKLGVLAQNAGGVPAWTTIIKGTMEQAQLSWQKVTIRVRDRQQDLAVALQQNRFGGTNSLPNGLDGVAGDLGGRPKPLIFGQVFNIQPPCVNTTRLIYQLHDGSALQSIDAVYDRGVALTAGAAYTNQGDMEANAPAAGQYRVWNSAAGAYIRLGSNPTGTLTVDATQGAAAANRTAGQLFNAILTKGGISSGDISASDITTLDAAAPYPLGLYLGPDSETTGLEALDKICGSVGAWFGVDALGTFRTRRIEVPTGTSVGTITTADIVRIERIASRDNGSGIPAWKVNLDYQPIGVVQTDLAAGVAADRKAYLGTKYRRTAASDATVKTANLTSPELTFPTQIVSASDAATEAARLLTIYKARRDFYDVTVRVDAALAAVLDLGVTVTLQHPRYGMSAGKKFLITSIRADLKGYLFGLVLWG